ARGVTGDERQIALFCWCFGEWKKVGELRRLAVLVDAHERDVEVIARELEVVGVAAEERDGELGREDEPHVLPALVLVERVLAAVVEGDDVAAHGGARAAAF